MFSKLVYPILFLTLSFANSWAQSSPLRPGLTLILPGFSASGKYSPEWTTFAQAIRQRAGKGSIYINDRDSGLWLDVDNHNTHNPEDEVILIYDWAWASNNLRRGFLEAAADHLFSALLSPPRSLGHLEPQALLHKPMHLIGHSRGAILALQLAHRMGFYFPEIQIEQFTSLDPHPAIPMEDCELPGTQGKCPPPKPFHPWDIQLQLPANIERAINYYRWDGVYEDVINNHVLGAYDGVTLLANDSINRPLNDSTLTLGSYKLGGAHSSIGTGWYYGTIDWENAGDLRVNPFWFIRDQAFPDMAPREETGFYRSRLGGGPLAPLVPPVLKMPIFTGQRYIFNGDFAWVSPKKKQVIPGWERNGGEGKALIAYNPATQEHSLVLKRYKHSWLGLRKNRDYQVHSRCYLPENLRGQNYGLKIGLHLKYGQPEQFIQVSFLDQAESISPERVLLGKYIRLDELGEEPQAFFLEIPTELKGKVGSLDIRLAGASGKAEVEVAFIELFPDTRVTGGN